MKKTTVLAVLLSWVAASSAFAAATVTVDENNNVSVTPGNQVQTARVIQPVVVADQGYVTTEDRGKYEVQGEIVAVDYPNKQIVVRDFMPAEHRITGDSNIISTLKVG